MVKGVGLVRNKSKVTYHLPYEVQQMGITAPSNR